MRLKWGIGLLLTGVMTFGLASAAFGYGTLGETDQMYTPYPTTLSRGSLGIGVNFAQDSQSYFNFDYGLVPDLEAGVAVFNYPDYTRVTFRGKFRLLREDKDTPSLAIGIEDIGKDGALSPYLTVGKTFSDVGVKGYIGVGGGGFDGIFGGLGKTFNTGSTRGSLRSVELYLEADSHTLNLGTKLQVGSQTKINFGLVDMDRWILGATFLIK